MCVSLRRRILADVRAVFPGRPPLCFFRMASSDGFFLTDAASIADVLEEGSIVTCYRADSEAAGAPLPEEPGPEDVESVLAGFRSQIGYVARTVCHAALKAGSESTAEATDVCMYACTFVCIVCMFVHSYVFYEGTENRVATGGAQRNDAMKSNAIKASPLAAPSLICMYI